MIDIRILMASAAAAAFAVAACSPQGSTNPQTSASDDISIADGSTDDPLTDADRDDLDLASNDADSTGGEAATPQRSTAARSTTARSSSTGAARTQQVALQDDGYQPAPDEAVTVVGRRPVQWSDWPTRYQMQTSYPDRALERGVEGQALISCQVAADGELGACQTLEESPRGYRFGAGAQRVARYLEVAQGEPTIGQDLRLRVLFQIAETDRNGRPRYASAN